MVVSLPHRTVTGGLGVARVVRPRSVMGRPMGRPICTPVGKAYG